MQRQVHTPATAHLGLPATKVSVLNNKLRVASEESHGETATVGVFIDAGSVYENEKTNGVAHFLEHMAFKGTRNRNRSQLEEEIENLGATLNAYTSREHTVYYAKVFKNDVPKAVDILSDIITNSTLDNEHVEAERSTILKEMEEVEKDPNEIIFDHLHAAAFQGTALGRTILGPADNVKKITRDDLVSYIKTHYHSPRIVVAGAGAVNHDDLVKLVEKSFASLPNTSTALTARPKEKTAFTGSQVVIADDTMDDAHVVVALEGLSVSDPDYYTLLVIQTIMGSWDRYIGGGKNLSSRLCETVAVEGLAHSFNTFSTCFSDTGLFGVHAVTPENKVADMVYEIMMEINRIGKLVSEAEVDRAKAKLRSSILMSLDGSTPTAEDIGRQLLQYGRRLSPAEIVQRINAITVSDVRRLCVDRFEDAEPAVAAMGKVWNLPDYNFTRSWTFWRSW
jgi:processing peptidase subunit beta